VNQSKNQSSKKIEKLEFRLFGKTIEVISVGYGIFLIFWGITISLVSQSQSLTSLIPSIFGFFLIIFSVLALKIPKKQMIFMHIVVLLGLLIMLGGADLFRGLLIGNNPFTNIWAGSSKLVMFLTGLIFIFTCIKSFAFARKIKKNGN
jgi:hypothetical protein